MHAKKYWPGLLLLFVLCSHMVVAGDEVHLTSGDYLIGKIVEVGSEYVVINTAFADQLKIKHELISELISETSIPLVFEDGYVRQAIVHKSSNYELQYEADNVIMSLDVTKLAQDPKAVIEDKNDVSHKVKYTGSVDIGLSRSSGNEDDEDYHGALMAQARTLKNRYTLEVSKTIEKNDGDKTQDETFGSLQFDHFINTKWYAFTSASFEEDLEELLNLRSTYSLGSGYQFYDNADLTLKAEMGLAYVDEDFEQDEDNSYTGGRWAVDYEHAWLSWLGFFHNHEGFFSLENIEDINIRSSSGFKFPLNGYINAKLEANIDWNRSPAQGATGTDKEYIFTLGHEF